MKIRYLLLLLLAAFFFRNSYAQEYLPQVESRYYVSDSVTIWKPKPLRAAGEVIGTNLAVWAFDRFIVNESWARIYNPQIQISAESETKRSIFREKDKTKRSKKESAQHSKSRNKSFVMTSVSAL